jgi:steroid delta-isomerase-like uncharacterized protein
VSRLETLALIESYYRAFNAGDAEGMLELLSDDVAHDINQGARETGKVKFREFLARMTGSYQETLTDLSFSVSIDGSRAAAEYLVLGKYLKGDVGLPEAHGQTYRLPGGAFFSIEGGRITRVTNYYNLEDWLAQVRNAGSSGR